MKEIEKETENFTPVSNATDIDLSKWETFMRHDGSLLIVGDPISKELNAKN